MSNTIDERSSNDDATDSTLNKILNSTDQVNMIDEIEIFFA